MRPMLHESWNLRFLRGKKELNDGPRRDRQKSKNPAQPRRRREAKRLGRSARMTFLTL